MLTFLFQKSNLFVFCGMITCSLYQRFDNVTSSEAVPRSELLRFVVLTAGIQVGDSGRHSVCFKMAKCLGRRDHSKYHLFYLH